MLRIYSNAYPRIKEEVFLPKQRALPVNSEMSRWQDQIVLGLKESSLSIARIEQNYIDASSKLDEHWNKNYSNLLDEFEVRKQAAILTDKDHTLNVYNYDNSSIIGEAVPLRFVSLDRCDLSPMSSNYNYPERFPRPISEVNVDLAHRFIAFEKYRYVLLSRRRYLDSLLRIWIEDDIRNRYPGPYSHVTGFVKAIVYTINGRTYIYKVQATNQSWIEIAQVISGLNQVEEFRF